MNKNFCGFFVRKKSYWSNVLLYLVSFSVLLACSDAESTGPSADRSSSAENDNQELSSASSSSAAFTDTILIDERDGKSYRVVRIGSQVMMAENLNYEAMSGSFCYDELELNCDTYGRLYLWLAATAGDGDNSTGNPNGVQGVCPKGWHIPSYEEWKLLAEYDSSKVLEPEFIYRRSLVGEELKATEGWENNGNGTDELGFSALPGGRKILKEQEFMGLGESGIWWGSSTYGGQILTTRIYDDTDTVLRAYTRPNKYAASVRCFRDTIEYSQPTLELADSIFTDERDGQKYRKVQIGNQIWMGENLNFETPSGSHCYQDVDSNCIRYGRLYDHKLVRAISESDSLVIDTAVSEICPSGWRIPGMKDWETLDGFVGYITGKYSQTGPFLKAVDHWSTSPEPTDDFGFSALMVGYLNIYGYQYSSSYTAWWTSTLSGYYLYIYQTADGGGSKFDTINYEYAYPIRCIQR